MATPPAAEERDNQNSRAIKLSKVQVPMHTHCCAVTAATVSAAQPVTGPAAGLVRECVCGRKEAVCGGFLEGWDLL